MPEKANSVMLVLATMTAPAARSRCTTAASATAGAASSAKNFGAGAGRLAGDVEQILDADDGAIERTERNAARRPRIGGVGRGARGIGIDRKTGARTLPLRIGDMRQRLFEPIAAGACFMLHIPCA